MIRVTFLLLVLACGAVLPLAHADDALPRAAPADRYAKMSTRSPFAPPSNAPAVAPAPPPPPGPKWSDELAVTGLTQEGGVFFATVFDKAKNERFLLQSNKEDLDRQLAVTTVQWGDLPDQTTVTLRHNNEFAAVHFDASTARAPSSPAVVPGLGIPISNQPRQFKSQPAALPQNTPTVVRRLPPIRANPGSPQPMPQPPKVARRPVSRGDDEGD